METEREKNERQSEESRQIILDIDEGMRSRYWKHIENKLKGFIETRKVYGEILSKRLIKTPEDVEERNDYTKSISMLEQFLKINQTIIDENIKNIELVEPMIERNGFVGHKNLDSNGSENTNGR